MDIDALQTLQAIAQHGSFTSAALALNVTQPAISKRVAKLEKYYGTQLLERSGHSIYLTESGRALLAASHDIDTRLNLVMNELDSLRSAVTGSLKIITSHHISLHRLPPVLKLFYDRYPQVNLHFYFVDSEIAYQDILTGKADFGVVTLAPQPVDKILEIPLWDDPLAFMMAPQPLGENRTKESLQNLATQRAVLPGMDTYTGQLVKALFNEQGLPLQASMETNYLETIKMMVSVGLGWTMLPKSMLDDSVQEIHVDDVVLQRSLGIIRRESYKETPAARAFFNLLREHGNT